MISAEEARQITLNNNIGDELDKIECMIRKSKSRLIVYEHTLSDMAKDELIRLGYKVEYGVWQWYIGCSVYIITW